jgi:AcrR family transcriptional regulator
MTHAPDRIARRRARTADEIVDAAEVLVIASGPSALTAKALADAVGVTPGALYKHFPSLDAVLARVQARVIRDLVHAVDADVPDDPLAAVVATALALVAFARREPHRYGLLARMLATPEPLVGDEAAADVLIGVMAALGRVRGRLAAAREAGALGPGDDDERLLVLWSTVHGAAQLHKLARFTPLADSDRVARNALFAVLIGWGAAPESARRALSDCPVSPSLEVR